MATKMFRLELADLFRGLFVAGISAVLTFLQDVLTTAKAINWKAVAGVGIAAGVAYLLKNLATNEKDEVLGIAATAPENPPPAKE